MSDGMRDSNPMHVDTSERGIAISHFYGPYWNPNRLGPLLTKLYDAGIIDGDGKLVPKAGGPTLKADDLIPVACPDCGRTAHLKRGEDGAWLARIVDCTYDCKYNWNVPKSGGYSAEEAREAVAAELFAWEHRDGKDYQWAPYSEHPEAAKEPYRKRADRILAVLAHLRGEKA